MEGEADQNLKIMVLGDAGTGKTSIIRRFVHNFFSGHHKTTVGVDFHLKQMQVGDKSVRLQLWDIAGQDRYGHISRVYYKNALGAMLVYDVSRPKTFETVAMWKEQIDQRVLLPNGEPIPVVLIGNKIDLEEAEVDSEQLDRYCEEKGFVKWFDTSAKFNHNIENAARYLVSKIMEHEDILTLKQDQGKSFQPSIGQSRKNGSGCC
jgi:Ras-related protein Rab-32